MREIITLEDLQAIHERYNNAVKERVVESIDDADEQLNDIMSSLADIPKLIIAASAYITMNKLLL